MVNFVLSFCKITGASRIFSRNFYLPLLKPLTPREAFRTFRITGKWLLGSKIQRYIPVLLNSKKKRSKISKNYGKTKHKQMKDYTYMTPILDPENESQKILSNILQAKNGKTKGVYVYTIEDKRLNIVFQSDLENAVRDGDIIDVLVGQKMDKILIKLKDFKKIPMELDYYDCTDTELFHGEGATTEADEKLHHYGKYTMSLAKIFEDKEQQEEEWELKLKEIIKRRRRNAAEKRKEYKALVKENLRKLDWDQFEEDAKKVVEEINEAPQEKPIDMEIDNLEKTLGVTEFFNKFPQFLPQLPNMNEIQDVLKNMDQATSHELNESISGVKLHLSSGSEKFVVGQMAHTEDGEIFVPGQTIQNGSKLEFTPGFTVNIDGVPTLINGLIMSQNNNDPMFLPTQSTITSDGLLTFALSEEERPPPPPEEHFQKRKERRIALEIQENPPEVTQVIEEENALDEGENEVLPSQEDDDEVIILLINENDLLEENSDSEISEIDSETYRLKQEKDRKELEELQKILLEDGMEKLVNELEDKKMSLEKRLEEMRKLKMEIERPLISYVTEKDAMEIVLKITQNNGETQTRLIDILLTLIRKVNNFRYRENIHPENILETHHQVLNDENSLSAKKFGKISKNLQILLKSLFVAANKSFKERPKDQLLALEKIGEILVNSCENHIVDLEELVDLMKTPWEINEICEIIIEYLTYDYRDSKVNLLSRLMSSRGKSEKNYEEFEKLMKHHETMCGAFIKLCKINGDLYDEMLEYCKKHSFCIKIETDVLKLLETSIKETIQSYVNGNFEKTLCANSTIERENFIEDSLAFANALGLTDVITELANLNFEQVRSEKTRKFLQRIFLIKNLINKDFTLKSALERLRKNPELARNDPRIRQLIRESGVLLNNSSNSVLSNSKLIPLQLLKNQNLLAIEDFIVQRINLNYPILIIRNDFEVVIPKEASQSVQSGRVPYVLIDENGISNFKPLHSFDAFKGSKNVDHVTTNNNNNYSNFNSSYDKERRNSSIVNRRTSIFAS